MTSTLNCKPTVNGFFSSIHFNIYNISFFKNFIIVFSCICLDKSNGVKQLNGVMKPINGVTKLMNGVTKPINGVEKPFNGTNNSKKLIIKEKKTQFYDKWESNMKL